MALVEKLVRFFDLPEDTTQDLPRITWIAKSAMTLQGRHRLIASGEERMIFATAIGHLVVSGKDLCIGSIAAGETEIRGMIDKISYEL